MTDVGDDSRDDISDDIVVPKRRHPLTKAAPKYFNVLAVRRGRVVKVRLPSLEAQIEAELRRLDRVIAKIRQRGSPPPHL